MTMKDQLTGFGSALSQTGAVNYVVQTGFQEDQEIFTGNTTHSGGFVIIHTELFF